MNFGVFLFWFFYFILNKNDVVPEFTVEGLPALSPTATDGAIVEWLVQEGDMVEEGSGIAEIQTDKSAVTWTATDEAYVAKLLYPVSTDVRLPVGTPLAVFVESKDDVAAFAGIDASAFLGGGSGGGSQPVSFVLIFLHFVIKQ